MVGFSEFLGGRERSFVGIRAHSVGTNPFVFLKAKEKEAEMADGRGL